MRATLFGVPSRGWMCAPTAFSMSGPAAAPVSAFTLNPLSIHGLWLAVMTMPAFAFLRIVAHEDDCVGGAVVAGWTGMPCAATPPAAGSAKNSDEKRPAAAGA